MGLSAGEMVATLDFHPHHLPQVWYFYVHHTHSGMVNILVSQEFYLSMDLYQDFNWKTVLIKRPNGLTSSLLIMLFILKSRSERKEFSWLQRFQWFWSSFSSDFYGIKIPQFHKIKCPNRYLRACIECIENATCPVGSTLSWSAEFKHRNISAHAVHILGDWQHLKGHE
jgi:hypothetical protein